MRAYIKKIQAKEERERKQILVGLMIGSMSIVSLIWVYSLGVRFSNPKVKEQTSEDIKPFKLFSNSIKDTVSNIGASVNNAPSPDKLKEDAIKKEQEQKQINLIPVEYTNQ